MLSRMGRSGLPWGLFRSPPAASSLGNSPANGPWPHQPRVEQSSARPATCRQIVETKGLDPVPSWLAQEEEAFFLNLEPQSRN